MEALATAAGRNGLVALVVSVAGSTACPRAVWAVVIGRSDTRSIKDSAEEQRLFERRARTGFAFVVVCLLALLGRYVWLQVIAYENFSTRSESNRVNVRPLVPNRGLIYDRRGRVIAENRPAYRLEIVPEKVPGKSAGLYILLD